MSTEENVRNTLELYLRGELDTAKASETAELIKSDRTWEEIHRQLLQEKQGIRFHNLQLVKKNLFEFETELKKEEKNPDTKGDLFVGPALTHTINELKGSEVKTDTHVMKEEIPNKKTLRGIRYNGLLNQLNKLKQEEESRDSSGRTVKKEGRVIVMRRTWLAVAAGLALLVIGGYFLTENRKPEYVNHYLMDHFNEYILHDKFRGNNPGEKLDRDKEIGYDLYVLKEFEEAVPYLKRRWEMNRDTVALFYLAVSYAGMGDKKNSLESFSKIDFDSQKDILFQNVLK